MRRIFHSALFLACVFRTCCQRRLTRWWSGPLAVRSSGWTGTSSVVSSRPHPGTTLSSSCSLPCSLKGSALSAGMDTHRRTQDQCKNSAPSVVPTITATRLSFFLLPEILMSCCKFTWCTGVHLQWKSPWPLKSHTYTRTSTSTNTLELIWYFMPPPLSTYT